MSCKPQHGIHTGFGHVITNQPTPCSRILEKWVVPCLIKKLTALYETCRFITLFRRDHHCPYPKTIQWILYHLTYLRSIFNITLPSVPRSSNWFTCQVTLLQPKLLIPFPHTCHTPCPCAPYLITWIIFGMEYKLWVRNISWPKLKWNG